jgi:hypothetical protein
MLMQATALPLAGIPSLRGWREYLHLPFRLLYQSVAGTYQFVPTQGH